MLTPILIFSIYSNVFCEVLEIHVEINHILSGLHDSDILHTHICAHMYIYIYILSMQAQTESKYSASVTKIITLNADNTGEGNYRQVYSENIKYEELDYENSRVLASTFPLTILHLFY